MGFLVSAGVYVDGGESAPVRALPRRQGEPYADPTPAAVLQPGLPVPPLSFDSPPIAVARLRFRPFRPDAVTVGRIDPDEMSPTNLVMWAGQQQQPLRPRRPVARAEEYHGLLPLTVDTQLRPWDIQAEGPQRRRTVGLAEAHASASLRQDMALLGAPFDAVAGQPQPPRRSNRVSAPADLAEYLGAIFGDPLTVSSTAYLVGPDRAPRRPTQPAAGPAVEPLRAELLDATWAAATLPLPHSPARTDRRWQSGEGTVAVAAQIADPFPWEANLAQQPARPPVRRNQDGHTVSSQAAPLNDAPGPIAGGDGLLAPRARRAPEGSIVAAPLWETADSFPWTANLSQPTATTRPRRPSLTDQPAPTDLSTDVVAYLVGVIQQLAPARARQAREGAVPPPSPVPLLLLDAAFMPITQTADRPPARRQGLPGETVAPSPAQIIDPLPWVVLLQPTKALPLRRSREGHLAPPVAEHEADTALFLAGEVQQQSPARRRSAPAWPDHAAAPAELVAEVPIQAILATQAVVVRRNLRCLDGTSTVIDLAGDARFVAAMSPLWAMVEPARSRPRTVATGETVLAREASQATADGWLPLEVPYRPRRAAQAIQVQQSPEAWVSLLWVSPGPYLAIAASVYFAGAVAGVVSAMDGGGE